jgi:membrane-bound ClpP family serine protease
MITKKRKTLSSDWIRNNRWIAFALVSGLVCGLGNFLLGLKVSQTGIYGPGFTGPIGVLLISLYMLL